jgi:hypothetical protein
MISFTPQAANSDTSRNIAAGLLLRSRPRVYGTMQ